MKILFVSTDFPYPPNNGVRIKLYHALRLVSSKNQTALVALVDNPAEIQDEQIRHIKTFCSDVTVVSLPRRSRLAIAFLALVRGHLFFMERYRDKSFCDILKKLIQTWSPDILHLDTISLSQYGKDFDVPIATVLSANDSYALNLENEIRHWPYLHFWQGLYRMSQYFPARWHETKVYPQFDVCHFVSSVDGGYITKLNPLTNVVVIPNGVDINYFRPPKSINKSAFNSAIYVGNVEGMCLTYLERFLEKTWRRVRKEVPGAKLNIVGKNPANSLKKLAADIGGISLKGYVKDLNSAYTESLISVVPVRKNCGIINKALESMAMGLIVVGFKEIYQGIPGTEHNVNCISADSYENLAIEIVKIFMHPEKANIIRQSARDLMEKRYSWESLSDDFCNMYSEALKRQRHKNCHVSF
ncbi:MAG: glycosyltransferase family 4 protein [Alkaliphilus sp.]|nr:glycosyltransferase family 4 protein [Alkaliphilus sp.]